MGPDFKKKKNPYTWVQFSDCAQILHFCTAKTPQNWKISEKWAYFSRRIINNRYPFLPKWPLKTWHTPVQTKSEYPLTKRLLNRWNIYLPSQIQILYLQTNFCQILHFYEERHWLYLPAHWFKYICQGKTKHSACTCR